MPFYESQEIRFPGGPPGHGRRPRVPLGGFTTSRSLLVVQWMISMSVIAVLLFTSSNANACSCISLYSVLILLVVLLYGILIPIIFIPRFAEIWGRTSLCGSARALYRALVRLEGSAFFSQYGEPAKLCQSKLSEDLP